MLGCAVLEIMGWKSFGNLSVETRLRLCSVFMCILAGGSLVESKVYNLRYSEAIAPLMILATFVCAPDWKLAVPSGFLHPLLCVYLDMHDQIRQASVWLLLFPFISSVTVQGGVKALSENHGLRREKERLLDAMSAVSMDSLLVGTARTILEIRPRLDRELRRRHCLCQAGSLYAQGLSAFLTAESIQRLYDSSAFRDGGTPQAWDLKCLDGGSIESVHYWTPDPATSELHLRLFLTVSRRPRRSRRAVTNHRSSPSVPAARFGRGDPAVHQSGSSRPVSPFPELAPFQGLWRVKAGQSAVPASLPSYLLEIQIEGQEWCSPMGCTSGSLQITDNGVRLEGGLLSREGSAMCRRDSKSGSVVNYAAPEGSPVVNAPALAVRDR